MNSIVGDHLRSFINRVMRLEDEISDLNADKSEVFKEAKANGFDTKVMRALIRRLRSNQNELFEFDNLLSLYEDAYKGAEDDAPSRARARAREDDPKVTFSAPGMAPVETTVGAIQRAADQLKKQHSAPVARPERASAGDGDPRPSSPATPDTAFEAITSSGSKAGDGPQEPGLCHPCEVPADADASVGAKEHDTAPEVVTESASPNADTGSSGPAFTPSSESLPVQTAAAADKTDDPQPAAAGSSGQGKPGLNDTFTSNDTIARAGYLAHGKGMGRDDHGMKSEGHIARWHTGYDLAARQAERGQ